MASNERSISDNLQRRNIQRRISIPLAPFVGTSLERVFSFIPPLIVESNDASLRRIFSRNVSTSTSTNSVRNSGVMQMPQSPRSQLNISPISTRNDPPRIGQGSSSSNLPEVDSGSVDVQNVVINMEFNISEQGNGQNEVIDQENTRLNAEQENLPEDEPRQTGNLTIEANYEDFLARHPELRIGIKKFWQYLLFICLVLVKLLFDKITSIFILICLLVMFVMGDKVVRRKATYQCRSFKTLVTIVIAIPITIYLSYRIFNKENFFYSAILMFPDYDIISLEDLMWIITFTDIILKLITVMAKSLVVLLPKAIMMQRYKGNMYALLERISQLYRSVATIQPWLSYLLSGYVGNKKILGVFLSVSYLLCKCPDIIIGIKELRKMVKKVLSGNDYGGNPSQAELDNAGNKCPICYDNFSSPLLLNCSHIFCESCLISWLAREKTCPMCRTNIWTEKTSYRDGSTSYFPQIY